MYKKTPHSWKKGDLLITIFTSKKLYRKTFDEKNRDTLAKLAVDLKLEGELAVVDKIKEILEETDRKTTLEVIGGVAGQQPVTFARDKEGIAGDFFDRILRQCEYFLKTNEDELTENDMENVNELTKKAEDLRSKYIRKPAATVPQKKGIQAYVLFEYLNTLRGNLRPVLQKKITNNRLYRLIAEIIHIFENYSPKIKTDKKTTKKLKKLTKKWKVKYRPEPVRRYEPLTSEALKKLTRDIQTYIAQVQTEQRRQKEKTLKEIASDILHKVLGTQ